MRTVDSSIVVAALIDWHPQHDSAARILSRKPRIASHALVESYSVLTRLPAPHRLAPGLVGELLSHAFEEAPLVLDALEHRKFLSDVAEAGLAGGAVYDALIARTAVRHHASLVTADERAARTYEAMGVVVESL